MQTFSEDVTRNTKASVKESSVTHSSQIISHDVLLCKELQKPIAEKPLVEQCNGSLLSLKKHLGHAKTKQA